MSLIYNPAWKSIKDRNEKFWAFYALNQKEFDNLLWKVCWAKKKKYQDLVDERDMRSELLLTFHRSNFLEDFNSEKSQFGTFLTTRVNGYAQHIITKIFKALKKSPKDMGTEDSPWVDCVSFDEEVIEEAGLKHDPKFDETLTFKRVYEAVEDTLSEPQKKILDLYFKEGYKIDEIAEATKITNNQIVHNIPIVKSTFVRIAKRKGLIAEKSKKQIVATFDHAVSASTFQYGITVPKSIHSKFSVPQIGQKREIQILFGKGQQCRATLRTLGNDVGRVQIRYKNNSGKRIASVLGSTEMLKVGVIDDNTFKII